MIIIVQPCAGFAPVPDANGRVAGYRVGRLDAVGPHVWVGRWADKSSTWLRFSRKSGASNEWWVTGHKTKSAAIANT